MPPKKKEKETDIKIDEFTRKIKELKIEKGLIVKLNGEMYRVIEISNNLIFCKDSYGKIESFTINEFEQKLKDPINDDEKRELVKDLIDKAASSEDVEKAIKRNIADITYCTNDIFKDRDKMDCKLERANIKLMEAVEILKGR